MLRYRIHANPWRDGGLAQHGHVSQSDHSHISSAEAVYQFFYQSVEFPRFGGQGLIRLACSPGALTVQAAGVCGSPRASSQVWATSAGVL